MQREKCEVLVVGAGPTGLMAACLLEQSGISVRIIDKTQTASQESRAAVMSARSLELFASLDLCDTVLAKGIITRNIDFFISGRHQGGLDYNHAASDDTPFRFILMIPQSATEAILIDRLKSRGIEVERGTELVAVRNLPHYAEAEVVCKNKKSTLTADFIIGADGGHSSVRHLLGLNYDGAKYPQNFLLGDVRVNWQWDHQRFRVFMHGERIGLFLPLEGSDLSRVMTTDLRADTGGETAALTLDELQQAFSQAAQVPVELSAARWLTKFRTHHRLVNRYRAGRIFVAGDAAHIHSPAGGQGMNTGLQDAANLVWKIKSVLHYHAAEPLLDSYELERLPVARETLAFTDKIFHLAAGQKGWRASLRDRFAPLLIGPASRMESVQEKAFRKFGQLDISYPAGGYLSEIIQDGAPAQPGERAPDAQLSRHQDLFDLLAGYRFTVLFLSRKRLEPQEAAAYLKRLSAIEPGRVQALLIAAQAAADHPEMIATTRNDIFERYGLSDEAAQAVFVIRPDGFIAWRSEDDNLAGADAWLSRFFSVPVG